MSGFVRFSNPATRGNPHFVPTCARRHHHVVPWYQLTPRSLTYSRAEAPGREGGAFSYPTPGAKHSLLYMLIIYAHSRDAVLLPKSLPAPHRMPESDRDD